MATMANHDRESTQPICQNCATSTTPLWRRDEMGSVLCNACGLFLKLHGRPRPISLKTDVIKSRNRVKTSMRPDMAMKKKNTSNVIAASGLDQNGVVDLQNQAYAATAALTARRAGHKTNGHLDGTDGSLVGAAAAVHGLYGAAAHANAGPYALLDDSHYQNHQHLQPFGAPTSEPNRALSPVNGDQRLDGLQSQEQLVAANSSLKTRVAELEVINDFIQRRLGHYEPPAYGSGNGDGQDANHQAIEAQLRSQVELLTQSETQLRSQISESHQRENMLKHRLDELELELRQTKDALADYESGRATKKPRLASSFSGPSAGTDLFSTSTEVAAAAAAAAAVSVAAAAAAAVEKEAGSERLDQTAGESQEEGPAVEADKADEAPASDALKDAAVGVSEVVETGETAETGEKAGSDAEKDASAASLEAEKPVSPKP